MEVAEETAQPRRRSAVFSALVFVVSATIATGLLHWANRDAPIGTWWMGSITIAVGLGVFGTLLAHRLPGNPIGWLMIVGGVAQAVVGLGREWAVFATVTHEGRLPGPAVGAWVGSWGYLVSIATLPLVLLVFPDGHLPSPRWRKLVWMILGAVAVGSIASMLISGEFTDELPTLVNPIGVDSPVLPTVVAVAQVAMMGAILAAVVSLIHRSRGATGELRQQMRWITFAGSVLGLELVIELIPFRTTPGWFDWLGPSVLVFFLFSITVSVSRWRLWDIDVLISRSLVYATLTLLLGGTFVGIVALSGRVRGHPVDYGSSLAAAAITAVAFAPVRDHLQHRIDRRLYGDRRDPYLAVRRLGDRLGVPGSDDSILEDVADAIATSLRLDHVAILAADGATLASIGAPRPDAHTFPLVYRTGSVGVLRVARRVGAPVGQRESAALSGLAPLVAVVVQAVAVTDALQRSRLALVTTREEERRRIRRDLHDGLGPALAAVRMKLDGARVLVDSDPQRSKAVIDQLSNDIRTTITDIRRLVYDLRPPALDELGLVTALRELARSFNGPTAEGSYLTVEFSVTDGPTSLSAACEVALYRIISESLTNVVRHAAATRCRVRLDVLDPTEVRVVIDDDGVGRPTGDSHQAKGIGTRSMMDRAAELGGDFCVERSPLGGTRIVARLPSGMPVKVGCDGADDDPTLEIADRTGGRQTVIA